MAKQGELCSRRREEILVRCSTRFGSVIRCSLRGGPWRQNDGTSPAAVGWCRFANKYGVNVDGYSPIYTPDTWSESGDSYKLGAKGLIAW
jgi:hypothetical protein